jgi:hypothetical protein
MPHSSSDSSVFSVSSMLLPICQTVCVNPVRYDADTQTIRHKSRSPGEKGGPARSVQVSRRARRPGFKAEPLQAYHPCPPRPMQNEQSNAKILRDCALDSVFLSELTIIPLYETALLHSTERTEKSPSNYSAWELARFEANIGGDVLRTST